MTGVEATKVEVYNSYYHDNDLEVFLKVVKDGWPIVTRGWTKVVRAYGMQEGTLCGITLSFQVNFLVPPLIIQISMFCVPLPLMER